MIIFLANDSDEHINEVCLALESRNIDYLRINDDLVSESGRFSFEYSGNTLFMKTPRGDYFIEANSSNVVWNRKFGFIEHTEISRALSSFGEESITSHLKEEYFAFLWSLRHALNGDRTKWIRYPREMGKYLQMIKARQAGIEVPAYRVTNSKESLSRFIDNHKEIISKPLGDAQILHLQGIHYSMYVRKATQKMLDGLPDYFMPSLLQKYIEKKYEIRTFVFDRMIFSIALFTQSDIKTAEDFRHYNKSKPNRFVPYKLPRNLESRILNLMDSLELNTGSIDLIKGTDGKYYFLEVNTDGQYGMVSDAGNYHLPIRIAEYLAEYE